MTNTTLTAAQLEERDYQELMVNDKGFFGVTNRVLGIAFSAAVGLVALVGGAANAIEFDGQLGNFAVSGFTRDSASPDFVAVNGPSGISKMNIFCERGGGNWWNAQGPNTKPFHQFIANRYCSTYIN